jgi:lysine-specific demethylase/histidyl-hydroxylase NO66
VPDQPHAAPGETSALRRCVGDSFPEWGQSPLLRHTSDPFADLLSLDAVDELLAERGLRTPFLRLVRHGRLVNPKEFTGPAGLGAEIADQVRDDLVLKQLADGATLVLQGLHRIWPPLREFCQLLAADLGCAVQANAYLTPPGQTGFKTHYDTHDVFVLQIAGEKHWRVHEPVHPDPLPQQPWGGRADEVDAATATEPVLDQILYPGDVLYLPRGWLHAASAVDEVSLHVTLGLHRPTRYTLVEALLKLAAGEQSLRSGLPLGFDVTDPAQLAPELAGTVAALTNWLSTTDPELVARRLRQSEWAATRPEALRPVAQAALLTSLSPDTVLRARRGLRFAIAAGPERMRISLVDKTIELPTEAEPIVRELLGGDPVKVAHDPDRMTVARRLLREGLLVAD